MIMNRKREPKGLSTGGRFAREERGEVGAVSLTRPAVADAVELADSAARADTSREDWERLSSPEQPAAVRLAAASSLRAGAADRAAEDPDPVVRMAAVGAWDLSAENEKNLSEDPEVQRIAAYLAA